VISIVLVYLTENEMQYYAKISIFLLQCYCQSLSCGGTDRRRRVFS